MYTVDYFIQKFSAIPSNKIIPFNQSDGFGNHCAWGWCGEVSDDESYTGDTSIEGKELETIFKKSGLVLNLTEKHPLYGQVNMGHHVAFVPAINNGWTIEYQQPTPKQRILASLYDIKAMQEKEAAPIEQPKKVIEYRAVRVPETILNNSELTKETN